MKNKTRKKGGSYLSRLFSCIGNSCTRKQIKTPPPLPPLVPLPESSIDLTKFSIPASKYKSILTEEKITKEDEEDGEDEIIISSDVPVDKETWISDPLQITINGITFTLVYKIYDSDRLKIKIKSQSKEFLLYQSNSELGFWRLCLNLNRNSNYLYKGKLDYVQSTFVHLELQKFINENIDKVKLVTNQILSQCRYTFSEEIKETINDKNRIIANEEPFDEINQIEKTKCGRIPPEIDIATPPASPRSPRTPESLPQIQVDKQTKHVQNILKQFSKRFKEVYDFNETSLTSMFTTNFVFQEVLHTTNTIYSIILDRKIYDSSKKTNQIILYFNISVFNTTSILSSDSPYYTSITKICDTPIHFFPFLLTPINSTINRFGLYTTYIPCGIYICKPFDYHTKYKQCTLSEITNYTCTKLYSYIGNRYKTLFPLKEVVQLIQERTTCVAKGKRTRRPISKRTRRPKSKRISKRISKQISKQKNRIILQKHL